MTSQEVREKLIEMLPRRFSNAPSNMRKFKAHDEVIKYVRQQEKLTKAVKRYFELKANMNTSIEYHEEFTKLEIEMKEMAGVES